MLKINDTLTIEEWELTESFVRSSGPGGQNVNKVSSAVELRFEAERSPNLPGWVKAALKRQAGRRWTKDGAIVLFCDETRHQVRNREIVRERLAEMIRIASVRKKRRVATKPTFGSQQRRMDSKTKRGTVKGLRGKIRDDD